MPLDPATFRSILGRFASGVTIVTARDSHGTDHGMTVSAFCSLSLQPPLVLMCIERSTAMHDVLHQATHLAVNVLASTQESLSRRFSEPTDDRFAGIGYSRGVTGAAILHDVLAHLECRLVDRHPGGDHCIIVGEVIAGEVHTPAARAERPLLYYRGGYSQLER